MTKIDFARMWSLHHRLTTSVIASVAPAITDLGLEVKELFLLAVLDDNPHPAALSRVCLMPKPTVTIYLKRLEAAGFLTREIDSDDLRRHRLKLTIQGCNVTMRGMSLLADAIGLRLGRLDLEQQKMLQGLLEKLV